MAKKNCLIKNENELLPLKKSGLKIALIGALANDKTAHWVVGAVMMKVLFQYWKDFKSMKEISYVKGADVSVGRTQFVWETKINMTDNGFLKQLLQQSRLTS
jgi:beta-glucosidase